MKMKGKVRKKFALPIILYCVIILLLNWTKIYKKGHFCSFTYLCQLFKENPVKSESFKMLIFHFFIPLQ